MMQTEGNEKVLESEASFRKGKKKLAGNYHRWHNHINPRSKILPVYFDNQRRSKIMKLMNYDDFLHVNRPVEHNRQVDAM